VDDLDDPTSGRGPGFAEVSAFRLFEAILAETQTGTVCLKQGVDHERSNTLRYSDFLQRVEEQTLPIGLSVMRDAKQRAPLPPSSRRRSSQRSDQRPKRQKVFRWKSYTGASQSAKG
jgi:hypothetical protein